MLKRLSLTDLVQAVQDLEEKGYQCVHPIVAVPHDYRIVQVNYKRKAHAINDYSIRYMVTMEKKEIHNEP